MHELSLMKDLFHKIESIARQDGAGKVVQVHIKLGALCHISPSHFAEHFTKASIGTIAENARLEIDILEDIAHPQAQDVLLDKVVLE